MSDEPLEPCQDGSQVGDLMTPKPVTVTPDIQVVRAFDLMCERRIRHIPVVDEEGQLVGIVSQRDLIGHVGAGMHPAARDWDDAPISDVMNERVDTVTPGCCAAEAARHMLRNKRGSLPVVDEKGLVIGIVTEADFVRLAVRGQPACSCVGVQPGD